MTNKQNFKRFYFKSDVKIAFNQNNILVSKGIWNKITIEIEKQDFSNTEWIYLIKIFQVLVTQGYILQSEIEKHHKILELFQELNNYFIVEPNYSDHLKVDFLITDYKYDNFKIFNTEILNFEEGLAVLKAANNHQLVILFLHEYDEAKYLAINKIALKKNIAVFYAVKDGNYLHLIAIKKYDFGCFECVNKRFMARMQWEESPQLSSQNFKTLNVQEDDCEINYLIYLIKLILSTSQRYNQIILNNKILSIYLNTFEIHVDNILKVPFCETCGQITKMQAKENNVTLKTFVEAALKSNGKN